MDDDTTMLILIAVAAVLLFKPDLLSGLFGRSSLVPTTSVPTTPGAVAGAPVSCPQGSAWDGKRCIGLGFHPTGGDPTAPGIPVNLPAKGPGLGGQHVAGGAWAAARRLLGEPGIRDIIGAPPLTAPPPKTGGAFGPGLDFALSQVSGPKTPVQGNTGPEAPRSLPAPPAAVGEAKAAIRRAALFTPRSGA